MADLIQVQFTARSDGYEPMDIAAFAPDVAADLVRRGVARAYTPPPPEPAAKPARGKASSPLPSAPPEPPTEPPAEGATT